MTKKTLQGIATGILLATSIFAYNLYFTNNLSIIKEAPISEKLANMTEADKEKFLAEYTQAKDLVIVDKAKYEQLLKNKTVEKKEEEKVPSKPDKVVERVIIKEITLIIEPGMSSGTIASLLKAEGLISDKKAFVNYINSKGLETKIKAGKFLLTSEMTLEEIVDKMT